MNQTALFDFEGRPVARLSPVATRAARDEGMIRAEVHADEGWKEAAYRTVVEVARSLVEFTTDDVWAAGLPHPVESRALGPVLMRLAREGRIVKTGAFVKTKQVSRHAADIAVWRLA